jgi:predicted alpha/beta superfamily hydrolase
MPDSAARKRPALREGGWARLATTVTKKPGRFCPCLSLVAVLLLIGPLDPSAHSAAARTSFTLRSTILNEERSFEVHVPSGRGPFDTVYVLDGQAHFANVVDTLARVGRPETIVVGLGNIWLRDRDYTPTQVAPSAFVTPAAAKASGGGKRFIEHVRQELIPYIDAHYPANASRTLIGHSLGGLIAVEILLKHPRLFQRFVVIDPSLWWDDAALLQQSRDLLRNQSKGTRMFVAIAAAKNRDRVDVDAVRRDTTDNTALIRPSVLWLDSLTETSGHGMHLAWKYYNDQDHMSVVQTAIPDGLRFVSR